MSRPRQLPIKTGRDCASDLVEQPILLSLDIAREQPYVLKLEPIARSFRIGLLGITLGMYYRDLPPKPIDLQNL
jgi:hypothetical protein